MNRNVFYPAQLIVAAIAMLVLSACGGGSGGNSAESDSGSSGGSSAPSDSYTITASAGVGGSFDHGSITADSGSKISLTVKPDAGYGISSVTGCGGSLSGNSYTTGAISADCTVSASFVINRYTVTASAEAGGHFNSSSIAVDHGGSTSFTVITDTGYSIDTVSGCSGALSGNTFTTGAITADCTVSASFTNALTSAPTPTLDFAIKQLLFSWPAVANADHYRILVNPDGLSGFSLVSGAESITGLSHSVEVPVHKLDWLSAEYLVEACNADESICLGSVNQTLIPADSVAAIGYFKASNTEKGDEFGYVVSLSSDGNTLAVGAPTEDSAATGVNGDETADSTILSGAVYVFYRSGTTWRQQAYLKASNTNAADHFGSAVSLSSDGNTLAVGAYGEGSSATGIAGDQTDNSANNAGAVYVFSRNGTTWSQQVYLKASNTNEYDRFGEAVSLSGDGNVLAVGAPREDSNARGTLGTGQGNNGVENSGAVYVFVRSYVFFNGITIPAWSQQAYLKASNTGADDFFGWAISLSSDGNTLAVGAYGEDSDATGAFNDLAPDSGAVYVFSYSQSLKVWYQQAYLKASNSESEDYFGFTVALAGNGNTLAVGSFEGSNARGVGGDETNNSAPSSGAVYVFSLSGDVWSQQAYLKASNSYQGDYFGGSAVSLSYDGNTLAVGAYGEDGANTGIAAYLTTNTAQGSGAVYVFNRSGTRWRQQAYVKASNTDRFHAFGSAVSLSGDGDTLAVGASLEDSAATGVGGNQAPDEGFFQAGAVYLY